MSRPRIYALVFDTETTGLFPKKDPVTNQYPLHTKYPHITQLSFVVYNVAIGKIEFVYNRYIKVPEEVVIDPIITQLTGVTRELLNEQGIPIADALTEFYQAYLRCNIVAAHNIEFDREMILLEFSRLATRIEHTCPFYACIFNNVYEQIHDIETYCTMRAGRNMCNIMMDYKVKAPVVAPQKKEPSSDFPTNFLTCDMSANDMNVFVSGIEFVTDKAIMEKAKEKADIIVASTTTKKQYKKMPKLVELYTHLFGKAPANLHNSLIDTIVCMRCFIKMRFRQNMAVEYINMYLTHEA